MANELTVYAALLFNKNNTSDDVGVDKECNPVKVVRNVLGGLINHQRQAIGVVEEAIAIGAVPAGGYIYLANRDDTNFISIRRATGEANFIKLLPGDVAVFRLHEDAPAPFAVADTDPCDLEFLIVEA